MRAVCGVSEWSAPLHRPQPRLILPRPHNPEAELLPFLEANGYAHAAALYGAPFNGYMGQCMIWPRAEFSVAEVDVTRIGMKETGRRVCLVGCCMPFCLDHHLLEHRHLFLQRLVV